MSKVKLLTTVVLVLLALNIATLVFMMCHRSMRHRSTHGEGPKKLIIATLHFDEKQQEDYENLIQWHRVKIDSLDTQILQTRNHLYLQLLRPTIDDKVKDSLIWAISESQQQIERTHFTHFQDIKKICKPDQLAYYDDLTADLAKLFSKSPRKKHD